MEQQELFMQAQMIEQELQRISQHKRALEEELSQTEQFNAQMKDLPNAKDSQILAPLGRGVFAKAKMNGGTMIVQVGAGIAVEREMSAVMEILSRNSVQLKQALVQLQTQEDFYVSQMQSLIEQARNAKSSG